MILIDIPMPRCCLNCECANSYADSPFWDVYCKPLQRYIDESQTEHRQDDCPLKEVVHCKDCKHWQPCEEGVTEEPFCKGLGFLAETGFDIRIGTENDYCSFGERKDDD